MTRMTLALLALIVGLLQPSQVARADYNAAADFSPTSNPNGAWSYGSESSLSGGLTLFHTLQMSQGNSSGPGTLDILTASGFDHQAALFFNGSSQLYQGGDPGIGFAPGVLAIEAGSSLYGVTRFTAPTSGLYDLKTSFFGITIDTARVLVVLDGTTLFSAKHSGYGPGNADDFSGQFMLKEGDTLDFVVGPGPNGNAYDYVGLDATISLATVPEPSSLVLLALGSLSAAAMRARCRSRRERGLLAPPDDGASRGRRIRSD